MKKQLFFGLFLLGIFSCAKEELTTITGVKSDPPKSVAQLVPADFVAISGVASVWVEIEQNEDYTLHSYFGKLVMKSGQLVEFAAKEQLTLKGMFIAGSSWYNINGVQYEGEDFSGPGGRGVMTKLNLRLPDGSSLSDQGLIHRTKAFSGPVIKLKGSIGPMKSTTATSKRFAKITLNGKIVTIGKNVEG